MGNPRHALLWLVILACWATHSLALEHVPWFHWGPQAYALEDVFISVHWSICGDQAFNISEVSIRGDGTVAVNRTSGSYAGDSRTISKQGVLHLISEFYRSGFFYMDDEYPGKLYVRLTDDGMVAPGAVSDAFACKTVVTFSAGEYSKTVDSWGAAPPGFDDLAREVAETALFGIPIHDPDE